MGCRQILALGFRIILWFCSETSEIGPEKEKLKNYFTGTCCKPGTVAAPQRTMSKRESRDNAAGGNCFSVRKLEPGDLPEGGQWPNVGQRVGLSTVL